MTTILIADDSVAVQRAVQVSFANTVVDVNSADNFQNAVGKTGTVELVIVDVDIAGLPSLGDLHKLTRNGAIPILLMISSYSKINRSALQDLGFENFLAKPFDHKTLQQVVASLLQIELKEEVTTPPPFPAEIDAAEDNNQHDDSSPPLVSGMEENLALLVKKAVFEYCQNNFADIARETVLNELRKLQEEKIKAS